MIERLDLNIFYFNEGEILTRFLYNSNSFKLENYSLKNAKLNSEKLYLSFDGSYFSIKNENSTIVYAEYIEPNKFFSSKYLSGIIKPLNNPEEFKKNIQSSKSFFVIPTTKDIKNEIISGLEINISSFSTDDYYKSSTF